MQVHINTQHEKCDQIKNLLSYYMQQLRKTQEKLVHYQSKLVLYQKQQQKMAELQKVNQEQSARLLQSVSNIRDLLHSNKILREQLNREKCLREMDRKKVEHLEAQLFRYHEHQSMKDGCFDQQHQSSPALNYLKSNKQINIHKLAKFNKLSKLNPIREITQKRHSLATIHPESLSPTAQGQNIKLKKIFGRYKNNSCIGVNQAINPESQKTNKVSRSLSTKKQDQKYLKAQLKRKKSLCESHQRMEMLQHKPSLSQY